MTATAILPAGVRREIVVRAIAERPGLGVSELAALTGLHENYLARLLPRLIDDGQVIRRKDGVGLFPAGAAARDLSLLERCPDCFGCGQPCTACVAAAGDPAVEDYVIGPGVEQVRRCGCGRVYGAYRAGRAWCFLMVAPGSRQVTRCVRCGQPLSAKTTSDCTGSPSPPPAVGKASRDMSRTTSRAAGEKRGGIPARTRHELDRAASRLRERFASRPTRRRVPSERWVWSSERAEGCERAIRGLGRRGSPTGGGSHTAWRARRAAARSRRGVARSARRDGAVDERHVPRAALCVVYRSDPGGPTSRGALLQEGLSPGGLEGPAEAHARPVCVPAARDLRMVHRPDVAVPRAALEVLRDVSSAAAESRALAVVGGVSEIGTVR